MAFRVRLGKHVSVGATGVRVGTRVGRLGYVSTGSSGTYIGARLGPVSYNKFTASGRGIGDPHGAGPSVISSQLVGHAPPGARFKKRFLGLGAGWYWGLGIPLIVILTFVFARSIGIGILFLGPVALGIVWAIAPRRDRWTYVAPSLTGQATIDLDGVGVADTWVRADGLREALTQGGRNVKLVLVSEPGNPYSPTSSAVRVDAQVGAEVREAGYLPEWAGVEATDTIRANADHGLSTVTQGVLYGEANDPRGIGVWMVGPDNVAVTNAFTSISLKDIGSKSIAVEIPPELSQCADMGSGDFLLRAQKDSTGVSVYYSDGRYLGELSDAQSASLRPGLSVAGEWFLVSGSARIDRTELKVRVEVPKIGDLRKRSRA